MVSSKRRDRRDRRVGAHLQLCLAAVLSPRLVTAGVGDVPGSRGSLPNRGPSSTILCPSSTAGAVFSVTSLLQFPGSTLPSGHLRASCGLQVFPGLEGSLATPTRSRLPSWCQQHEDWSGAGLCLTPLPSPLQGQEGAWQQRHLF